jgi:hypothetical protein
MSVLQSPYNVNEENRKKRKNNEMWIPLKYIKRE